jgi:hypothetical protein
VTGVMSDGGHAFLISPRLSVANLQGGSATISALRGARATYTDPPPQLVFKGVGFFMRHGFCFAALAALGLGFLPPAHARQPGRPEGLPAAHAWYLCSSANGEVMVSWVNPDNEVVAVSGLQEAAAIPDYALAMVQNPALDRHSILPTVTGYRVMLQDSASDPVAIWGLRVGGLNLTCGFGRDE